jgi:hypothetical protein
MHASWGMDNGDLRVVGFINGQAVAEHKIAVRGLTHALFLSFEIDGPAELIGENPFALMGGQAALYVKARHEPGTVTIRATTPRLEPASEIIIIQ